MQKNLIAGIVLISSPTLFALVAYPDTISMSWNEGRGGFMFAIVFLVAELFGIKLGISKKKLFAIIPLAIIVIAYLVALDNGLQDYIRQVGIDIEVPLIHSWIWLWDYVIMTAFVVATLFIYFGKKWIFKKRKMFVSTGVRTHVAICQSVSLSPATKPERGE